VPTTSVPGGDIDAFRSSLDSDFTLKLAPFIRVDLVKLYEAGKLANAAANNAGAPYRGVFGAIPDNINITDLKEVSNVQEKIENFLYNTPGLIQGWQMNPDDALVIVTKTPPECAYFSYCGFISISTMKKTSSANGSGPAIMTR